jgi:hypothetical protein
MSIAASLSAQRDCRSFDYQQKLGQNPSTAASVAAVENFLSIHIPGNPTARGEGLNLIRIPVVIHVLYHVAAENLGDDYVRTQITALNRDFRKQNADTSNIPNWFAPFAADCGIEFVLAKVDPSGRATNGIVHKYTPVTIWNMDDKIKYSSETGDDAWDARSYLNIWVGTMNRVIGYSSFPGDPLDKDGVVLSNSVFGITNSGSYNKGRTAVHEVGHWLSLRHLWGDADCGDDGVADTPKQQTFTNGCPSAIRITCGSAPYGDMYMDYMDFTNDNCLLMFTKGQMQRMRALFDAGGARNSILSSKALGTPTVDGIPLPEKDPTWLHIQVYPNPATTEITVNMEYDARWIGKEIMIVNIAGQVQIRQTITSKVQRINISALKPGMYFIRSNKEGEKMMQKFVKL